MILYDNVRARWRESDNFRFWALGDEKMTPDNFEAYTPRSRAETSMYRTDSCYPPGILTTLISIAEK
jgi:hypothetical protein